MWPVRTILATMMTRSTLAETVYDGLTGAPGEPTQKGEAANGMIHVAALALTKLADALINPKLVLSWMLTALGAPGAVIGALVPVREAGALLPQLALATRVEAARRRRMFWAAGSALQGLTAICIGLAALTLDGAVAGWAILGALACLAVARSVCSLSYKDALARSIPKGRRGGVTGAAAAFGSAVSLGFAVLLSVGFIPLTLTALAVTCMVAGGLWLIGGAVFTQLDEREEGGKTPEATSIRYLFRPLLTDAMLRRFIAARACLTVTALGPPFILMIAMGDPGGAGVGSLGPMLLASAGASILSSWVWGRLSDRSSRLTLVASAALSAATFAALSGWAMMQGGEVSTMVAVGALFVAQIAYEGVRSGRKLHLTDMATDDRRARYTALSNTLIGIVLLAGGGFGLLVDLAGPDVVIAVFAGFAALGGLIAFSLKEVQAGTPG